VFLIILRMNNDYFSVNYINRFAFVMDRFCFIRKGRSEFSKCYVVEFHA
jgi:hypothetical protein